MAELLDFSAFDELVALAKDFRKYQAGSPAATAPVSEDPDRQFYQSGLTDENRTFEPEVYSVKSGDTLSRIAAMNPFTLQQLKEANQGLDFDDISIGQEIKLPDFKEPIPLEPSDVVVPEPAEVTTEELDPTPVEEPQTSETTSTVFATITKDGTSTTVDVTTPLTNGFDSLTLAEGTTIHLDGRGFVTLPHGIVPDANSIKKGDGTAFDPTGSHGLKAGNLASVDYSEATKYNISRTDYTSDEAWAKAVYAEFGERTATEYGTGFEDLADTAKQAAYDMTWNAGIGSASWSSVQTMLTEASKESDEDKTTENLIGFTTNFRSGTETVNGETLANYPRGLLKRRAQTYNLVAKTGEEATTITTTSVMVDGVRTGTKYDIKKEDGTVIKSWTKPDLNERLGNLEID